MRVRCRQEKFTIAAAFGAVTCALALTACNAGFDIEGDAPDVNPGTAPTVMTGVVDTCADNEQNGTETGVDCGGSCANACVVEATCTDNEQNGTESDVDCGGSCMKPCALGKRCAMSSDCDNGTCTGGICVLPKSCKELKDGAATRLSGVYTMAPAASVDGFDAYCDMMGDGGGWTLALKADGANQTFAYDAPLWTNDTRLNADQPALDTTEAKLEAFNAVSLTAIRVGIVDAGATRWVVVPVAATSLRAIFSTSTPITSALGRDGWKAIMANASLQPFCNQEGLNVAPGITATLPRVRIGIIGNEQNDCRSPDSWIGIGGAGTVCGGVAVPPNIATSVGNTSRASCLGDNGDKTTRAFGYVMVR